MNTLRKNGWSLLNIVGFGIGLVLVGAYMRDWWNAGGAGRELQITVSAFWLISGLLLRDLFIVVRPIISPIIENYQTRPTRKQS